MAPRSRFVQPEETILTLPSGDTLTVRRRLNAGQQREAYERMYEEGPNGTRRVNLTMSALSMLLAYLLDWTLVGLDGQLLSIRGLSSDELIDILNHLEPEAFLEIDAAINRHRAAVQAERDAEKKDPAGEKDASATSPSPFAVAGASSGSVN